MAVPKPPKKAPKKKKKLSRKPPSAKVFALAPNAISMEDAIQAVRDCLGRLIGTKTASKIKLSTKIADALPDDDDGGGLQSIIDCINKSQDSDLDPRDFAGGSFQDIADKLAGVDGNS
jgi:hypothetical protein